MKCIEDEIPFEVPEGWAWCRLKHVCTMAAGKAKPTDQIMTESFEGCYPCFGGNGIRGYVDEYNRDGIFSIVGRQGALCGNINIAKGKFYATEHAVVTTLFSGIDFNWSNYVLEALQLNSYATGAAQPGLSVANVLNVFVPVPPTQEQVHIGIRIAESIKIIENIEDEKENLQTLISSAKSKILDLAIRGKLVLQNPNDEPASVLLERIRAEKEELIKQGKIKRDKKESIIFKGEDNSYYETISNNTICIDEEIPFDLPDGWIWCRLKSLADPHENSFVDGPFGSNLKTDHYTDRREVRIIQLNNIGEFTWKNNGIKYTTYSHAETLSRCKSYPGDIVIAKMMPAGRAIIIPDIEDVYVISSDCVRLQLPNYIDKRYVMYMINSPTINKSVMKNVQGIGRTRTSLSKLKELLVPIPPYKQQCQISATFDKSLFYFDTINALCE